MVQEMPRVTVLPPAARETRGTAMCLPTAPSGTFLEAVAVRRQLEQRSGGPRGDTGQGEGRLKHETAVQSSGLGGDLFFSFFAGVVCIRDACH